MLDPLVGLKASARDRGVFVRRDDVHAYLDANMVTADGFPRPPFGRQDWFMRSPRSSAHRYSARNGMIAILSTSIACSSGALVSRWRVLQPAANGLYPPVGFEAVLDLVVGGVVNAADDSCAPVSIQQHQ